MTKEEKEDLAAKIRTEMYAIRAQLVSPAQKSTIDGFADLLKPQLAWGHEHKLPHCVQPGRKHWTENKSHILFEEISQLVQAWWHLIREDERHPDLNHLKRLARYVEIGWADLKVIGDLNKGFKLESRDPNNKVERRKRKPKPIDDQPKRPRGRPKKTAKTKRVARKRSSS